MDHAQRRKELNCAEAAARVGHVGYMFSRLQDLLEDVSGPVPQENLLRFAYELLGSIAVPMQQVPQTPKSNESLAAHKALFEMHGTLRAILGELRSKNAFPLSDSLAWFLQKHNKGRQLLVSFVKTLRARAAWEAAQQPQKSPLAALESSQGGGTMAQKPKRRSGLPVIVNDAGALVTNQPDRRFTVIGSGTDVVRVSTRPALITETPFSAVSNESRISDTRKKQEVCRLTPAEKRAAIAFMRERDQGVERTRLEFCEEWTNGDGAKYLDKRLGETRREWDPNRKYGRPKKRK